MKVALLILVLFAVVVTPQNIFTEMYSKLSAMFASGGSSMFHMFAVPVTVDSTSFNAAEMLSKGNTLAYETYGQRALASVTMLNGIPKLSPSFDKDGDAASAYRNILESMQPIAKPDIDGVELQKIKNELYDYDLDPTTMTYDEVEKPKYKAYKKLLYDIRTVVARINYEKRELYALSASIAAEEASLKKLQDEIKAEQSLPLDIAALYKTIIKEEQAQAPVPDCTIGKKEEECPKVICEWSGTACSATAAPSAPAACSSGTDEASCKSPCVWTADPSGTGGKCEDAPSIPDQVEIMRKQTQNNVLSLSKQADQKRNIIEELQNVVGAGRTELVSFGPIDKAHRQFMDAFDEGFFDRKADAQDALDFQRMGLTNTYLTYLGVNPWNPSSQVTPQKITINGSYTSSMDSSSSLSASAHASYGFFAKASASHDQSKSQSHEEETRIEILMDVFVVDIVRPWLDLDFLRSFRWQMPGLSDECVSPGSMKVLAEHPTRNYMMPLMTQRVVICEEATFRFYHRKADSSSASSSTSAAASGGFGPFSIGGKASRSADRHSASEQVDFTEISVNDRTILGFVSTVVQRTPPAA